MNNYSNLVDTIIKAEMAGNQRHELVLQLGPTPQYLVNYAGFPPLELMIQAKTISKACFDHGIKTSQLKRLPEILNSPKCLFRSANNSTHNSAVVLTFEFQAGSPIIIPIHPNKRVGRNDVYNVVSSVYGKEGPDPIVKWEKEGLLLWKSPS